MARPLPHLARPPRADPSPGGDAVSTRRSPSLTRDVRDRATAQPHEATRESRHGAVVGALGTLGLSVALLACGPSPTVTAPPTNDHGSPSVSATPSEPTPVPTSAFHSSPTPTASLPTTTRTAWGTIWDALPRGFPSPPAAEPTDTGDPEPVSAALAVPSTVATTFEWYRTALPANGYAIADVNGPYEDGGIVIDAVGASSACHLQVSLTRTGTTTTVTILLGAGCPFRA